MAKASPPSVAQQAETIVSESAYKKKNIFVKKIHMSSDRINLINCDEKILRLILKGDDTALAEELGISIMSIIFFKT